MPDSIDRLQREAEADPADVDKRINYLIAKSRIDGGNVLIECLDDHYLWKHAPEPIQDLAIEETARRLKPIGLELVKTQNWSCSNDDRVWYGDRNTGFGSGRFRIIEFRLATFRHQLTEMELNLIPGVLPREIEAPGRYTPIVVGERIKPFLIGRWPITYVNMLLAASKELTDQVDYFGDFESQELPYTGVDHKTAVEGLKIRNLRLPASNEWSHAYQAGTDTKYYFGRDFDARSKHVWYEGNSGDQEGCRDCVGSPFNYCPHGPRVHSPREHDDQKMWNAFGLVDMHGNVWEWCSDELEDGHVVRGTSYRNNSITNNFTSRGPNQSIIDVGIRAVCSIPGLA